MNSHCALFSGTELLSPSVSPDYTLSHSLTLVLWGKNMVSSWAKGSYPQGDSRWYKSTNMLRTSVKGGTQDFTDPWSMDSKIKTTTQPGAWGTGFTWCDLSRVLGAVERLMVPYEHIFCSNSMSIFVSASEYYIWWDTCLCIPVA